jgi:hypothetical protein
MMAYLEVDDDDDDDDDEGGGCGDDIPSYFQFPKAPVLFLGHH